VGPTHPKKGVREGRGAEKKKLEGKQHGTSEGSMPDRQTKRIVQVCRDTYPEEKASGLSKTVNLLGGQRLPALGERKETNIQK